MYLVELRPGKEELYRTGDELAAAIRSGDVDMHSRIYHRATSKWISVTLHPQYKAIVAEAWRSEHLTDLPTFFGSPDGSDLGERIRIMLDSTKLLFDPATMRSYTLSEYILKS